MILKYADDIKLYTKIDSITPCVSANLLQIDLNSVSEWSQTWNLKFNINKCSGLNFRLNNPKSDYLLADQVIKKTEAERDLGITIHSNLKPSLHVAQIVKDAERCLVVLKRTFLSWDQKAFLKLYKQVVHPCLEFATTVWNPQLKRDIQLLEKVQRRATRCIAGMKEKTYKESLQLLDLDSLETRQCYFDLMEMFKVINNLNSLDFHTFLCLVFINLLEAMIWKFSNHLLVWTVVNSFF